ncbi:MAG TPA: beta-aspartyl-peptidase [Catalimonadaceae bacterium]|nr:beta-aspartyl-peptidase [Catalimonadaceae bacterium]
MLKLIKNTKLYAPAYQGMKDILLGGEKILAIGEKLDIPSSVAEIWDAEGKITTPGLIDQHVHIIGAGGKHGYASMTPEIMLGEFIACGTTTVVGMLGTDASARSIKTLYAKAKALDIEGITAYMHTSYFGIDPITLTGRIQDDLIFIDKVLGCKLAIADERSSYPEPLEILRHLREVHVGGLISGKGGILHVHLGGLSSRMDILFEMVQKHEFPIRHISPTHVGRSKVLFDQAIEFAKLGGMIDITTGATKYTDPWRAILYALDQNVDLSRLTFSTDGHAGLSSKDDKGCECGFTKAPVTKNLEEVRLLIQQGGLPIEDAFRIITSNPAYNLSLKQKGKVEVGADADLCFFDEDLNLKEVIARGRKMMEDGKVIVKGSFETK